MNFRKEKRSNETHESLTDRFSRLFPKSKGSEAKLAYVGHIVTENWNALVVDVRLTQATGTAERAAALEMAAISAKTRATMGADRGYDTQEFVAKMRELKVTPYVAQNTTKRRSCD